MTDDIPKRYGDIFESVAAALLLDGGWNALESVYGNIYENELNNNKYVLIWKWLGHWGTRILGQYNLGVLSLGEGVVQS